MYRTAYLYLTSSNAITMLVWDGWTYPRDKKKVRNQAETAAIAYSLSASMRTYSTGHTSWNAIAKLI